MDEYSRGGAWLEELFGLRAPPTSAPVLVDTLPLAGLTANHVQQLLEILHGLNLIPARTDPRFWDHVLDGPTLKLFRPLTERDHLLLRRYGFVYVPAVEQVSEPSPASSELMDEPTERGVYTIQQPRLDQERQTVDVPEEIEWTPATGVARVVAPNVGPMPAQQARPATEDSLPTAQPAASATAVPAPVPAPVEKSSMWPWVVKAGVAVVAGGAAVWTFRSMNRRLSAVEQDLRRNVLNPAEAGDLVADENERADEALDAEEAKIRASRRH